MQVSYAEIIEIARRDSVPGDADFIQRNWVPVSKKKAFILNPYLEKKIENGKRYFYTCKLFNKYTGQCSDYENRPQICKGFPWYGRDPHSGDVFFTPDCGFKNDYEEFKKNFPNQVKAG